MDSSLIRGFLIFNFDFANYQIPSKLWCAEKALSNRIAYFSRKMPFSKALGFEMWSVKGPAGTDFPTWHCFLLSANQI